ncbi:MAG TPA: LamG domain-containing protein [Kofleriaceae bacterium]
MADLPDSGTASDPTGDAAVGTSPVSCKYPDSALRLCFEFEDRKFTPTAFDASPYKLNAVSDELTEVMRNNQPAAATYWNSNMRVPENPMLDITGSITFEAWMYVPVYHLATILQNDNQYSLTMDFYGRVSCRIGNTIVTSDPIGENTWRHIACTLANEKLSIHVDGAATKCQSTDVSIPTSGTTGTRIVPGFVGGIDDVHIYARKLSATEICSHADKTGCSSACSDE